MIAKIRIYGRDDDPGEGDLLISKATVETGTEGTDYEFWETETRFVNAQIEDESEEKEYINSFKNARHNYRLKYEIVPISVKYPDIQTNIKELMPHLKIADKNYLWIWLNDYKITCYENQTTNVLRVYNAGTLETESQDGQKQTNITLKELKRSMIR